ncbi:phage holin family protein [Clostridium chrysemydis]|uniref:phage holin family protein n=1 Tax=Clostridium chrysemydis TaxID=2665504 RepID=UPI001883C789|nr:phage holin family protein [Clostridium chrysemydis]
MENLMVFVPEQLGILVAGLYIIGVFLKKTPKVADWCIPWVLSVLGMVGSIGINVIGQGVTAQLVTTSILQGLCAAGVSVLGNQIVKQTTKKINKEE